jgi:hypothetical protein
MVSRCAIALNSPSMIVELDILIGCGINAENVQTNLVFLVPLEFSFQGIPCN